MKLGVGLLGLTPDLLGSTGLEQFHLSSSAIHSIFNLSGGIILLPADVLGGHHLVLASPKYWGLCYSWAAFSPVAFPELPSDPVTLYQASRSIHDPFNPGASTSTGTQFSVKFFLPLDLS